VEHVRLRPPDALGHEGGVVTVAAVLAEQGGGVPEPGDGLLGYGERPQRRVQGPSLRRSARRRPDGEVGGAGETGAGGEVAENPPQRRRAALLASGERRLGSGDVPDAGDVPGDLAVGEVVEDRMDHLGRHPAERCGPAGEVGVPGVAEAERHERVVGLVGEVGDQVDRLHEPVQAAGGVVEHGTRGLHPDHLLGSGTAAPVRSRVPLPRTAPPRSDTSTRILLDDLPHAGQDGTGPLLGSGPSPARPAAARRACPP
jgi:hypothetical protein